MDKYVDISMPNYVQKTLQYTSMRSPRDHSIIYETAPRKYDKAALDATDEEDSPAVSEADKKFIQQVLGRVFYIMHAQLTSQFCKRYCNCSRTSILHATHTQASSLISGLHGNKSRCHNGIPCLQHGP